MGKIRKAVRGGVEGVAYGIETAEFGVDTDPQIRVLRRGYGAGAVTDTLPQKLPKSEQVLNLISSIEGTGPLGGQSTVAALGYGTGHHTATVPYGGGGTVRGVIRCGYGHGHLRLTP